MPGQKAWGRESRGMESGANYSQTSPLLSLRPPKGSNCTLRMSPHWPGMPSLPLLLKAQVKGLYLLD